MTGLVACKQCGVSILKPRKGRRFYCPTCRRKIKAARESNRRKGRKEAHPELYPGRPLSLRRRDPEAFRKKEAARKKAAYWANPESARAKAMAEKAAAKARDPEGYLARNRAQWNARRQANLAAYQARIRDAYWADPEVKRQCQRAWRRRQREQEFARNLFFAVAEVQSNV